MRRHEVVDVPAIDRDATVVSPIAADRIGVTQIAPINTGARVMRQVRTQVRRFSAQPAEFREARVPSCRQVSMHFPQLPEAHFPRDHHLAHDLLAVSYTHLTLPTSDLV